MYVIGDQAKISLCGDHMERWTRLNERSNNGVFYPPPLAERSRATSSSSSSSSSPGTSCRQIEFPAKNLGGGGGGDVMGVMVTPGKLRLRK